MEKIFNTISFETEAELSDLIDGMQPEHAVTILVAAAAKAKSLNIFDENESRVLMKSINILINSKPIDEPHN